MPFLVLDFAFEDVFRLVDFLTGDDSDAPNDFFDVDCFDEERAP